MKPRVQSTVMPEPQTLNEWQAWLAKQRHIMWQRKLGRQDDLIDIERDNE